jgi:hypothetical protein
MVHISETCEPTAPHLLTQVHTTTAAVYEAQCTAPIHEALSAKDLAPREHFVDGAYIAAPLLVTSRDDHGIMLRGPTRPVQGWQVQTDEGYDLSQFTVDWEQRQARCPQGQVSTVWREYVDREGKPVYPGPLQPPGLPALSGPAPLLPDHRHRAPSPSPVAGAL